MPVQDYTALASSEGTPLTDADHAAGLKALGESAPGTPGQAPPAAAAAPPDPTPALTNIADALQSYKDAGSPPDRLPQVRAFVQRQYDSAGPYWQSDEGKPFAARLRDQGYIAAPAAASPGAAAAPALLSASAGASSLGQPAPQDAPAAPAASSPAPMVPMAPPPGSDAAYRQQIGALHDDQAAFNAKLKSGVGAHDIDAITQRMNQFVQWAGQNGHGDRPEFQKFIDANRANGYRLMDAPKPSAATGNYFTGTVLPDALSALSAVKGLADRLTNPLLDEFNLGANTAQAATDQADPKATALDLGQAMQSYQAVPGDVKAAGVAAGQAPLAAVGATGASSDPADVHNQILFNAVNALGAQAGGQGDALKKFLGGIPAGVWHNTEQHPVQQFLNVLPFLHLAPGALSDMAGGMDAASSKAAAAGDTAGASRYAAQSGMLRTAANVADAMTGKPAVQAAVRAVSQAVQNATDVGMGTMDINPQRGQVPAQLGNAAPKPTLRTSPAGLVDPATGKVVVPISNPSPAVSPDAAPDPALTPHPSAGGANGAGRASDGTFMSQDAPPALHSIPPVGAQNAPPAPAGTPQEGAGPVAGVSAPPRLAGNAPSPPPVSPQTTGYAAGSAVNLDHLNISGEAKIKIAGAAQALGLGDRPGTTHADIGARAQSGGLTVDDLRDVPPGKYNVTVDQLPPLGRAVRQLNAHAATSASQADAAYKVSRSPDDLAAAVQANQDLRITTAHNDAIGAALGTGLGERAADVDPFAARARDVQNAVRPFGEAAPNRTVATPAAPTYGAKNTLFSQSAYQSALDEVRQAGTRLNSGVDPSLLKNALTIGGYHFEAGLRAFPDWAKQMKQDLGAALSDKDLRGVFRQIRPEARQRAQALLSPKERVREQLLKVATPDQVPGITKDLANVKVGKNGQADPAALAEVLAKHTRQSFLNGAVRVVQGGLLQSPHTLGAVGLSHSLFSASEEMARAVAAPVSRGTVQGPSLSASGKAIGVAVREGLPRAGHILLKGQPSLALSGRDPFHPPGAPVQPEFSWKIDTLPARLRITNPGVQKVAQSVNAAANLATRYGPRLHGALMHFVGTGAFERGMIEKATLTARAEARAKGVPTGAPFRQYVQSRVGELRADPTPEMVAHAHALSQEQTFQNPNQAHDLLKAAEKYPVGKAVTRTLSPFSHVPTNVVGKKLEYTGGVLAGPKLLARHLMGRPLEAADQARLAKTFGRGVLGAGALALGMHLHKSGLLNEADEKRGEFGSVNVPAGVPLVGGNKVDTSRFEPNVGPIMTGNSIEAARERNAQGRGNGPLSDALGIAGQTIKDQPLMRVGSGLNSLDPHDLSRTAGGLAGMIVPQGLGDIAAMTDPTGDRRVRSGPLDYVKAKVPVLRETLPVQRDMYGNPVKETASLFSPLTMHKLGPTDTPAARLMQDDLAARRPQGQMTPDQVAGLALRQSLTDRARAGEDVRPQLVQTIRDGRLTERAANQVLTDAAMTPAAARFNRLDLSDAFDVYEAGNASERAEWRQALLQKLDGSDRAGKLNKVTLDRARKLGLVK